MATFCISTTSFLLSKPPTTPSNLTTTFPQPKLTIKIQSLHHFRLPHRPLPLLRASIPSISCSSHHTTPTLFQYCARAAAAVLVGSLLFSGRFVARPAPSLADAVEITTADDTQNEKDEDEMYVRMLEQNPKDAEALKVVLYGKMRKGKTREAVGYVERLIALEPEEVEWKLLQALSYELMGQLPKAKRLFKDILKENPLLIRALHGLALAMYKNHEGPAVFKMLNKAVEIARCENRVTEERNIKILIAQMHVVKGDLEEASRQFQDLVNEDPRDFRPYLCQGIIYSLLDNEEEADKQFEIYRSLVPSELAQRGFIDDVILAAKTESQGFQNKT